MKYTKVKIGETNINISGHNIEAEIWRNERGNLEIYLGIDEKDFPDGTCSDMYNEELTFYKFTN